MPNSVQSDLDLFPSPAVVHSRLAATTRSQRLLRKLLLLSLAARREREAAFDGQSEVPAVERKGGTDAG